MKTGYIIGTLFFLPFFLIGCFAGYQIFEHLLDVYEASSWEKTSAKISHIKASKGGDNAYISAIYEYQVDSKDYEGRKAGLINKDVAFGITFRAWQKKIENNQAEEIQTYCYYNPENPSNAVLFRSVVWDYVLFFGAFFLTFGTVGLGGIVFMFWSYGHIKREDKLKADYPNEPWKWREAWKEGVMKGDEKSSMLFMIPFALIWNSLAFPAIFPAYEAFKSGETLALLILIFPLVGIGIIYILIKKILAYNKLGTSKFILDKSPGVIGGLLSGTFYTGKPISLRKMQAQDIKFSLECFETEESRGSDDSPTQSLIWESSHSVSSNDIGSLQNSGARVNFSIPYECRETSEEERIEWKLSVKADLVGPNIDTKFVIPVFKTKESSSDITELNPLELKYNSSKRNEDYTNEAQLFEDNKILVNNIGERLEIIIPSVFQRMPNIVFGALLFVFIFAVISVVLLFSRVTLFISVIF